MTHAPDVFLRLSNEPESVSLVREMLSGLADGLALGTSLLDDMKTAVSEACNNVVLHAYGGERGPLEVDAVAGRNAVEIAVRDAGHGIQPRGAQPDDAVQGVGLAVIQALTSRVELSGSAGRGTEVRMDFRVEQPLAVTPSADDGQAPALTVNPGEILVAVTRGPLAQPVLGRIVAALAARASFAVDRISDAQLVSDAIAGHWPAALASRQLNVGIATAPRELTLRVGWLHDGGAGRLVRDTGLAGLAPVLERLSNELTTETDTAGELLQLRLLDPR